MNKTNQIFYFLLFFASKDILFFKGEGDRRPKLPNRATLALHLELRLQLWPLTMATTLLLPQPLADLSSSRPRSLPRRSPSRLLLPLAGLAAGRSRRGPRSSKPLTARFALTESDPPQSLESSSGPLLRDLAVRISGRDALSFACCSVSTGVITLGAI